MGGAQCPMLEQCSNPLISRKPSILQCLYELL